MTVLRAVVVQNALSSVIIAAEARSRYEHSIPAVTELRYSISFRTLR